MRNHVINFYVKNRLKAGSVKKLTEEVLEMSAPDVYNCTCSSSCGSNYSMGGGCVCSSSCGSNYSH